MFIHVYFCFPETSGKTLEQVEELFTTKVKAWQTRVDYQKSRREEAQLYSKHRAIRDRTN